MCKYCENNNLDPKFNFFYTSEINGIENNNNTIEITNDSALGVNVSYDDGYIGRGSIWEKFEINFCPMCGRNLKGEF